MRSLTAVMVVVLGLLLLPPAGEAKKSAQKVDMGEMTCEEFIDGIAENKDEPATVALVLMWIDGYLAAKSDDTVIDFDDMEDYTMKIVTYCKKHPDTKLLKAAEKKALE